VETIGNAGNIFLYIIGLVVFGFIYWLLDNMLDLFIAANVADTTTFSSWPLLLYVWAGIVIVYVVFGGLWLIRSFQNQGADMQ
jgi:lipopolysaccharide export LptBFGC system permease protein LptF